MKLTHPKLRLACSTSAHAPGRARRRQQWPSKGGGKSEPELEPSLPHRAWQPPPNHILPPGGGSVTSKAPIGPPREHMAWEPPVPSLTGPLGPWQSWFGVMSGPGAWGAAGFRPLAGPVLPFPVIPNKNASPNSSVFTDLCKAIRDGARQASAY